MLPTTDLFFITIVFSLGKCLINEITYSLIRVLQRTEPVGNIYKELAHMILEAESRRNPESCSGQGGAQGESMMRFQWEGRERPESQLKAVGRGEFPLTCGRVTVFVLFWPSTDGWGSQL